MNICKSKDFFTVLSYLGARFECVCVCLNVYKSQCVCERENKCQRLDGRAPEGTRQYSVTLQSPTDKWIHLLTPLTHLSDFVKWTIDHPHSLFLSFFSIPIFVSRFSFGRSLCMPSTFIHYYNYAAACRSLVISDRGVWDNRDSGRPQHALAGMRARRKTPAPTAAEHSHWLSKSTSNQDIVAGSHITGTILRKRTKAENHNLLHTLWQFFPSWDLLIGWMRLDLDQNWLMFEVCSRWTDPQIYEWFCVATDFWLGSFPQSSLHPALTFGYCDSPVLLGFQVWLIQAVHVFQLFLIIIKKKNDVNFRRIRGEKFVFFFFSWSQILDPIYLISDAV